MKENMMIVFFRFPSGRSLTDVKEAFYQKCKIPNTIGAVDGTFVPIIAPKDNEEIFVCRKNFHAINIQAVVDHKMRYIFFIEISALTD